MVRVDAVAELYALAVGAAPADSIYDGTSDSVQYGELVRAKLASPPATET
jgi:hypothetical protein